MAIQRQQNFLGQMRVDVPHLRSFESAICADFDLLAGRILAGQNPLVINGFVVVTSGITQADKLQILVADSTLIHPEASESGSIFHVPADRAPETLSATVSPRVSGAFTANSLNYIGVDLIRSSDPTTNDLVAFIDTTTLKETFRDVPLARTLDYRIVISTTDFTSNPNIAPIAQVVTGTNNVIVSVTDARNIAWRLGSGGSVPNSKYSFPWPNGRNETGSTNPFVGGDKAITSFKGWSDAVMTRLWELGGGEYWYTPTADRNIKMVRTGATFTSTGEHFEWVGGANLHWKGLVVVFDDSTGTHNIINNQTTDLIGLTDLADGDCIYVDLDRTSNATLTAVKAQLSTLGMSTVPGSRWIVAWRYGSDIFTRDYGWAVGSSFKLATLAANGEVALSASDDGVVPSGPQVGLTGALHPRVVTCQSTAGIGICGGISRGDTGMSADFFLGAGPIYIGGYLNDRTVGIGVGPAQPNENVYIYGSQTSAGGISTLQVYNDINMMADPLVHTFKSTGRNDTSGFLETRIAIESIGAIGHAIVPVTPSAPVSTTIEPIVVKTYFGTSNSLPDPRVMFADGVEHSYSLDGNNAETRLRTNSLLFDEDLKSTYFNDFVGQSPTGKITNTLGGTSAYSTTERGGVYNLSAGSGTGTASWSPSPDGSTLINQIDNVRTKAWDFTFVANLSAVPLVGTSCFMGWANDFLKIDSFHANLFFQNAASAVVSTSWAVSSGGYHEFRVTFDGSTTLKVYVDGALVLTDVTLAGGLQNSASNIQAAASCNGSGGSNALTLHIDKVFVATRNP